jgi:hypothetical protein
MDNKHQPNPAEHIAIGAGIGAAGAAQSIAMVGIAAAPVLPILMVFGAVGGLVVWGFRKLVQ